MYLGLAQVLYAFVCIFCSALCYFYWKFIKPFRNFPTIHFEQDIVLPLLTGKHLLHLSFATRLFNKLFETGKRFQREGLYVIWIFQPIVVVCNDTYTKVLLNHGSALDKPMFYDIVSELLGNGVATVKDGPAWKKRRRMLDPAFKLNVLKSQVSALNKVAKSLVKQLSEQSNNPDIDLLSFLKHAALKAFWETSFGINTDDQKYEQIFVEAHEIIERIEDYTAGRLYQPWLYSKKLQSLFADGRKHKHLYKKFDDFAEYMTRAVLDTSMLQTSDEEADNKSLARILIENHLKDPSFTKKDLEGEIRTFLAASYDTTSYTLLWCLFMLAVHPEVQENVFQELESLIENSEGEISYNDLNQMKHLDSVIKETMRLYPTFPILARKPREDIEFGKYKVPKNTPVVFFPYLLHRDPDIYPDPEKFDPERFYNKSLKHPCAYIPFSEGIRNCIGKNFAMMEMKIILGHILRNFKITSLDKREDIPIAVKLLLAPQKRIRFQLFQR